MGLRFNRHRILPAALNIIGLTFAFSVFLILSVQVTYDFGYDKGYPDTDKIVRLEYTEPTNPDKYQIQLCRPVIEYLKQNLPQAEAISCYRYYKYNVQKFRESGTEDAGINLKMSESDAEILKVFPFVFTQGDTSEFKAPLTAVISQKGAEKLFGKQSPVGKQVQIAEPDTPSYRIVAVYNDFPDNSSADNHIILNMGNSDIDNWSEWSYPCYMKLSTTEGLQPAIDSLKIIFFGDSFYDGADLRMSSLHDAYFSKDIEGDNMDKGNRPVSYTLLSVAILILVIAIFNFINFAMATVPFSIKNINTRKVLGARRSQLICNQLLGALALVIISFAASIAVMSLVSTSTFAHYISGSMKIGDNLHIIAFGLLTAILSAFVAGIFPARYSTSFNPAMVLKGSFSLSSSGRRLRTTLVAFQYLVSFVLIISALFITVQIQYMKKHDMGFDRENVLELMVSPKIGASRETLKEKLMKNPDILDVTFAGNRLVSQMKMGWGRNYQGERVQMDCLPVDPNFISFFGMEMAEGRDFTEADNLNPAGTFIVNEAFMNKYPFLRLGLKFSGHMGDENPAEIVGKVKDFNFMPLHYGISPLVLYNFGSEPWWPLTFGYVRINSHNIQETTGYIKSICSEIDPNFETEDMYIKFMDETIEDLYRKEENLNKLITIAGVISLIVSIIGILGLVYFETQFRRKEIALRRVHGAQVGEILSMINRYYFIITVCCFVVAIPVSLMIIKDWVSGFTYQSPVPIWIFVAAFALITSITAVTVTLLSRKTALSNPVNSVKTE